MQVSMPVRADWRYGDVIAVRVNWKAQMVKFLFKIRSWRVGCKEKGNVQ